MTKDDVKIAKNYLSEIELQRLNLLVSGLLDFAEFQALEMNPMTMKDWIEALDNQIIAHKRKVLIERLEKQHRQLTGAKARLGQQMDSLDIMDKFYEKKLYCITG